MSDMNATPAMTFETVFEETQSQQSHSTHVSIEAPTSPSLVENPGFEVSGSSESLAEPTTPVEPTTLVDTAPLTNLPFTRQDDMRPPGTRPEDHEQQQYNRTHRACIIEHERQARYIRQLEKDVKKEEKAHNITKQKLVAALRVNQPTVKPNH